MNFIAAGLSDVGLQREHNEDSFCILPEFRLFVVADGMGGHRAGDVASQMATHTLAGFFQATAGEDFTWPFNYDPNLTTDENRLSSGIKLANRRIYEAGHRDQDTHGMGTTVVSALFSRANNRIYVAHVGDSRCYRVRGGQIELLTRDHSLLNDYLAIMPHLTEAQRDELPKNVITRALGMNDAVLVDMSETDPLAGDVYLLCSDGLSGMIEDDELLRLVLSADGDVERAARDLVLRANENGGDDNVTVVVVLVTG